MIRVNIIDSELLELPRVDKEHKALQLYLMSAFKFILKHTDWKNKECSQILMLLNYCLFYFLQ